MPLTVQPKRLGRSGTSVYVAPLSALMYSPNSPCEPLLAAMATTWAGFDAEVAKVYLLARYSEGMPGISAQFRPPSVDR